MTKYLIAFLAAFCLLTTPAVAQDKAAEKKQEEKQELSEVAQLLEKHTDEFQEVNSKFQSQATEIQKRISDEGGGREEMMEAFGKWEAELKEATKPILAEIVKVAEMADKDADASMEAISFVMSNTTDEEMSKKVSDVALKHHLDHEKLPKLLEGLTAGMPSQTTVDFLNAVVEKSTNKTNQGIAALTHASIVEQLAQFAPMVKDNPQIAEQAPELVKLIESFDAKEFSDDGLILRMEGVIEKFGDVEVKGRTIEKTVNSKLKSIRTRAQTAVGKVAPEIAGPDIDGTDFKLSDYRGKVVMLDFWGDW